MQNKIIEVDDIENIKPYTFLESGKKVYSIEEFLYHIKKYTLTSIQDFFNEDLKFWIKDEIKKDNLKNYFNITLLEDVGLVEYIINFISIEEYLSEEEILNIKEILIEYEKNDKIQKLLKDIDFQIKIKNYNKAYNICKEALKKDESEALIEKMAKICFLPDVDKYNESIHYLLKLIDINEKNEKHKINLAYIYFKIGDNQFKETLDTINDNNLDKEEEELYYYLKGVVEDDISFFEKSYGIKESEKSLIALVDYMNKNGEFFNSMKLLEDKKGIKIYLKTSETLQYMNKDNEAVEFLMDKQKELGSEDIFILSELLYLYGKLGNFIEGNKIENNILNRGTKELSKAVILKLAKYNQFKENKKLYIEIYNDVLKDIKNEYILKFTK